MINSMIRNAGDDSFSVQYQDWLVLKSNGTVADHAPSTGETTGMWVVASGAFDGQLIPGDTLQSGVGQPEVVVQSSTLVSLNDAGLAPAVLERVLNAPAYTLWNVGGAKARCMLLNVSIPSTPGNRSRETQSAPSTTGWARPSAAELGTVGTSMYSQSWACSGLCFENNSVDSSGRVSSTVNVSIPWHCAHNEIPTFCPHSRRMRMTRHVRLIVLHGAGHHLPRPHPFS